MQIFTTKLIGACIGTAGVVGGIGGAIHLTKANKSDVQTSTDNTTTGQQQPPKTANKKTTRVKNKSTWRNYLVKATTANPITSEDNKHTCSFNVDCKIFTRDDSQDSAQSKTSNLTKVNVITSVVGDVFYVLNINNKTLKDGDALEFEASDSTKTWLQVISRMSVETDTLRLPKPPTTIIPKTEWANLNNLNLSGSSDLSKVKNRHFANSVYSTHIQRDDINHQSYMVFKWQDLTSRKFVHPNIKNLLYLPFNVGDSLEEDWQKKINTNVSSYPGIFNGPFNKSGGDDLSSLFTQVFAIDSYLFKPIDEQKTEVAQVGKLSLKISSFDPIKTVGAHESMLKTTIDNNLFIEIYEIEDQANIAKSFTTDLKAPGNHEAVNWDLIDKDYDMITKLSEMKAGKYYKFVFSTDEVVNELLKNSLEKIELEIINTTTASHKSTEWPLLEFGSEYGDFYCIKSESAKKCGLFALPQLPPINSESNESVE